MEWFSIGQLRHLVSCKFIYMFEWVYEWISKWLSVVIAIHLKLGNIVAVVCLNAHLLEFNARLTKISIQHFNSHLYIYTFYLYSSRNPCGKGRMPHWKWKLRGENLYNSNGKQTQTKRRVSGARRSIIF